jgi:peptidyl-prolyl cis-trans isomerase A (cyclophilin A)
MGYYEDIAFFRVIDGFMAQFGIHGNPDVNAVWNPNPKDMPKEEYEKKNAAATIADDPVEESNTRGKVTFAKKGIPNSRTVQLFINYADNARLDQSGFAPIGEVAKCMENVDALHAGYGEGAPRGQGPSQEKINKQGNEYLKAQFPELDYIETTEIIAEK